MEQLNEEQPPHLINATTLDSELYANKSIYDGINIRENVNPEDVFNIIHTVDVVPDDMDKNMRPRGSLYKAELKALKEFQYMYSCGLGAFITTASLAKHGWGRLIPHKHLSLSVMYRALRQTLALNSHIDADLVNCHFILVYEELLRLEMPCVHIAMYCNDVKKYRKEIASHYGVSIQQAKDLFIRILYGGKLSSWRTKNNINHLVPNPPILVEIAREMIALSNMVWDGNQHIYNDILKYYPDYFVGGYDGKDRNTIMAFWCQTKERHLQEQIITFLCNHIPTITVKDVIPCQDGFLIPKELFIPSCIQAINDYITNTLHGRSQVVVKPFDEYFTIKTLPKDCVFTRFNLERAEDAQFASYMLDVCFDYNDIISTGNDKDPITYQYNGIFWEQLPMHNAEFQKGRFETLQPWVESKIMREIKLRMPVHLWGLGKKVPTHRECKQFLKEVNGKYAMALKGGNIDEITKIQKDMERYGELDLAYHNIKGLEREYDYVKKLSCSANRANIIRIFLGKVYINTIEWDADPELFAFNNKVMHLPSGQFVIPKKEQFIKTICGWSWDDDYCNANIEAIRRLVDSILPVVAVRDYYIAFESTGLSGNKIQRVLISTGKGGNGKSLLRELKNKVVGKYGMKIPTELLCNPINSKGPDPVVANMDGKRSTYFSEPSAGKRICSATFKELSGDGDIVGRGLYSSKTDVRLVATISGDCNELPPFSDVGDGGDNSLLRRLVVAPFITTAVSQAEYDMAEDKTNLNVKCNYAEDAGWLHANKQAYFIILLEAYARYKSVPNMLDIIPDECRDRALAHITSSCNIMSWVSAELERVDASEVDATEAIPLKSLYLRFKGHDNFKTYSKADQRKYSQKYFIELLESAKSLKSFIKQRNNSHRGKQLDVVCIVGYRFIDDDEESGLLVEDE